MITIEAAQLARAMKNAASVVARGNTIPILANVLLRADGDELEIVTTDLDVEYQERVPLEAGGTLTVTVDAARLSAVASAADKGGQLALEPKDNRLSVKNGRSRWQLPALPSDDFPRLPFDGHAAEVSCAGASLAAALGRVTWSVGTEHTRYYLNGPLWHDEAGHAALAATNGHTLMRVTSETVWPDEAPELIWMPKFARAIESLAREAETVLVAWNEKMVRATIGAITLTAKAIQGQFPDYRRVLPPLCDRPALVDPEALRGAVRKATVLAVEKTRAVKIEREDGLFRLSCTSPDTGTAEAEVRAEVAKGHQSGFDARYLDQMLAAIGGDSVAIHQDSADRSPALFQRVVPDGAVGVVMPMRV